MSIQSTNVFVSYSHADASLVAPVVRLLRVNKSLVFQDIDNIQPGKKWRSEIAKGLAESHMVIVFWCDHARCSDEVSKEWKSAIEQEKDLLPLLLDATPLPPELSEFQWIDFRATVGASHTAIVSPANDSSEPPLPMPSMEKSRRSPWLILGGFAAVVVAVAAGSLFTLRSQAPMSTGDSTPRHIPPSPGVFDSLIKQDILLWLALLIAVTACLAWLLRWRSKRVEPIEIASAPPREIERHIASEIEAEILRRTALKHDTGA
ncbi:MAG: toll/interleukin-1 receptor domain-containing protein [Desulfuromonadales bacterium]|nr:MAG: toll/interleukin-1 receptor domain-containing protein [Desulfuromonadales bacterium]